jgi:hypothetical protein
MSTKVGSVRTPNGVIDYEVTWDKASGKVHVGIEYAGQASSADEAMIKANYYATTTSILK